jgi:poly(A) polymerase Pap1
MPNMQSSHSHRYYSATPHPDLKNLVFDTTLISTLSPSSLRPLNTYRDTVYLLNTTPHLESYLTAHRFLSLYLKSRGLYSAKFGYLGGIHLSLMLNRVVKLLASKQSNSSQPSSATIVRGFFTYYAAFEWASDIVVDPSLPAPSKPITRSPRDAVFIHAIHVPTARPNVASSCTRLSAQTLTNEFDLAVEKLEEENDWKWCFRSSTECVSDFMNDFGAFVRITVDAWDLDENPGASNVRDIIGILESRMVRLMITLGRINSLRGRVWPARFCARKVRGRLKENQLKGYYLVGVTALDKESNDEMKRLFAGKVVAAMREFEEAIREVESENILVGMDVVPKKKILEMDLVIDDRVWS